MSVYIPVDLQRRVRARFGNCCAYCRTAEALTVSIFEFEHIVPLSAGGETIFENICLVSLIDPRQVQGVKAAEAAF